MAIIKCKMCGGNIEISADKTYGTCDSCGSTMTFPRVSDEQRLNLFNRANHFRRQNDFDKAIAAYERILEEDANDAEAHWGIVLSRYGIEYVEDPVSHERIPTCHRVQLGSILADPDLLSAMEHAPDAYSAQLYQKEAEQIAGIQKGILAISAQEDPYDVFICYKESTDGGSRTKDSTIAQDIYYQLTGEGYKVFFSRITLEDKLGQQYEPYIFAALNSARVMLAIGTKPEHFSAVWVKNEWSRFLALMKQDRTKLLIPCYRDMDPYDLPEELSALQSQDMSKIGFMQDLLHGIRKVMEGHRAADTIQGDRLQPLSAAPGVSSLMERARLFMEDGDFASASEYLNRVLDIDPKHAPAYAAKACATFGMHKETDLADATFLYEDNADWQKALRFADSAQKAIYEGYIAKVRDRVNAQIHTYAYDCAVEMALGKQTDRSSLNRQLEQYRQNCLHSAQRRIGDNRRRANAAANEAAFQQAVAANDPGSMQEATYKLAADMFSAIHDAEADACAQQCLALAEQARQKAIYEAAKDDYRRHRREPVDLDRIAQDFLSILEYKDAAQVAQECLEEAEATRSKLYRDVLSAMEKAGDSSNAWQSIYSDLSHSALKNYQDADILRQRAEARRTECRAAEQEQARRQAKAKATKKKLQMIISIAATAAVIALILLLTKVIIPKSRYNSALELRANGQWEEAAEAFAKLGEYSDAEAQVPATYYMEGVAKREAGDWEGAVAAFTNAGEYGDAATQISATYYAQGEALRAAGDWDGAVAAFTNAGEYGDAAEQVGATYYARGEALRTSGDWEGAVAAFTKAGKYNDAAEQVGSIYYTRGEALRAAGDWDGAVTAFTSAGKYSDAKVQVTETNYQHAQALMKSGNYDQAYALFVTLRSYKDVSSLLANDQNLLAEARYMMFVVSKYVTFGTYPQTESGDDETPIEWQVLARDGNKVLLLSRYGLDSKPYHSGKTKATWEECTLRTWLNNDFINRAFKVEEQTAILVTTVDNSDSQNHFPGEYKNCDITSGNNTQDKVFLLSCAEAAKYLSATDTKSNWKATSSPTAYAITHHAYTSMILRTAKAGDNGWWWLRSSLSNGYYPLCIGDNGSYYSSIEYSEHGICVRPALWVDINFDVFGFKN